MCGVGEWVGCVARLFVQISSVKTSSSAVSRLSSSSSIVVGWLGRVAFFSVADTQWATPDDPLIAGTPLSLVAVCT